MDTIMLGEIIKFVVIFALVMAVTFIIVKSVTYYFLRIIEDSPELFSIMKDLLCMKCYLSLGRSGRNTPDHAAVLSVQTAVATDAN